jgi:hypothetical protein
MTTCPKCGYCGGKGDANGVGKTGTKTSGTFEGKSNKLGGGGRAAQLKAKGVPGGVIGDIARSKGIFGGRKKPK